MFVLFFNETAGGRAFVAAVDDRHSAMSMAKLLSRQDSRDVVVIENSTTGDTVVLATFRRGLRRGGKAETGTHAAPAPEADGAEITPKPL